MRLATALILAAILACPASTAHSEAAAPDSGLAPLVIRHRSGWPLFAAEDFLLAARRPVGAPAASRVSTGTGCTDGKQHAVVTLEFRDAAACRGFRVPGVHVFHRFQRFAGAFIPTDLVTSAKAMQALLERIRKSPGFVWMEPVQVTTVPPPHTVTEGPPTRQVPEDIVRGGLDGFTGKGVLLAIVDSGLDFRHPDFVMDDPQGQLRSRTLYFWDTTAPAATDRPRGPRPPIVYPDGSPAGVIYTGAKLTADLRSPSPRLPANDLNGHGTACASIAAGNGRGAPEWAAVRGVAPSADLIVVRVSRSAGEGIDNGYLLNAICAWLDSIAGSRPLVVSCSFGGHQGGHDGQLIEERELDAQFPMSARGRALVVAAGNERTSAMHAELRLTGPDAPSSVTWRSEADWSLRIYLSDADSLDDIACAGPPGMEAESWLNPLTHQKVVELRPTQSAHGFGNAAPRRSIVLFSRSGRPMTANLYLLGGVFDAEFATQLGLVTSPGTTSHAISVGSYDWNDMVTVGSRRLQAADPCDRQRAMVVGDLSCYSSPGYSRSGAVKPEVTAPGALYYASLARLTDGRGVQPTDAAAQPVMVVSDASGRYRLFDGTSAAAPYAAGCIALMLEKNPHLSLGQLRGLLRDNLTRDEYTGNLPNPAWGQGKLDLAAVRRLLRAVPARREGP
jgi:subtilisin family serine protease